MRLEFETEGSLGVRVFDAAGNPMDWIEYDTDTQEVTMTIPVRSKWSAHYKPAMLEQSTLDGKTEPVVLQFVVAGSYAMDESGKRL